MKLPRILLADDHTLLLEAFSTLLKSECEVVGAVADGRALVSAAIELKPDVIVLDITMPLLNGLDAARQVRKQLPDAKLIFLTMNEDPDLAAEAFRLGASAYLLKSSAASELIQAIHEAVQGRTYITPRIAHGLIDSLQTGAKPPVKELTPRQREVLQLIAEGKSMKESARCMNVTPRTVAHHKYKMMEVLEIETTAELIHYAIKHHIISG